MQPLRVAVTGGIGAGKSEVLAAFARRGVPTVSADDLVHELISSDPEVRAALEERFGTTDRGEIAKVVFSDRDELAWLEGLLHPRVAAARDEWLAGIDAPVAVAEIPLLYETGGEHDFDKVIVVTAPEDVRRARKPIVEGRSDRLLPDDE
jgi:dephospho-CoA kinase